MPNCSILACHVAKSRREWTVGTKHIRKAQPSLAALSGSSSYAPIGGEFGNIIHKNTIVDRDQVTAGKLNRGQVQRILDTAVASETTRSYSYF